MAGAPGAGTNGTARETFLTYFFGGNGPGPMSAATFERSGGPVSVGRDLVGAEPNLQAGIMAGKRDGSSAAFDMKSLGKHIEAVRGMSCNSPYAPADATYSDRRRPTAARI